MLGEASRWQESRRVVQLILHGEDIVEPGPSMRRARAQRSYYVSAVCGGHLILRLARKKCTHCFAFVNGVETPNSGRMYRHFVTGNRHIHEFCRTLSKNLSRR